MGTDPNVVVELDAVHKVYGEHGGTPALAGVSLIITQGAFVSLVGPSGSGKTTLLNLIAGLDIPDRGRVRIGGRDLGEMTDSERSYLRLRNIGFVFQAFNLVPSLSVYENVTWPLEFSGLKSAEVHERATSVLERDVTKAWTFTPELVPVFAQIYADPQANWAAYETCEELVDLEDNFQLWRFRHFKTVERIIGFKKGTGGSSGVPFLRRALELTFFPELFAVRTEIEG